MGRFAAAVLLLSLTVGCDDSAPTEMGLLGAVAGAGGSAAQVPDPDAGGGAPPAVVDAGAADAAEDVVEMPDGMLFGTGSGTDASTDVVVSNEPCDIAFPWEDGYSFWADEEPLHPGDYVTLDGTLYQYNGPEDQAHLLGDCAPDAPVSWCSEQGWIWETIGPC